MGLQGKGSEMGTPVKAGKSAIEYVLWGLPKGSNDTLDEKVLTSTVDKARVEKIKGLAAADGWHSFRIQRLDLSKPPDFTKTIRKEGGQ
jgi:hypothetical protein